MSAVAVALMGCPVPPPPGDVHMGQYALTAISDRLEDGGGPKKYFLLGDGGPKPAEDGGIGQCELADMTAADFSFDAVLTRQSTSQQAYVTLSGYSRDASFDGQVFTSTTEANRVFAACSKCSTRLVETMTFAVLSPSQSGVTANQCPENPLDGGVIVNPDAGILLPGETQQGFDGVLLCGELTTRVVALGTVDGGPCDPICEGCSAHYQLRGDRR